MLSAALFSAQAHQWGATPLHLRRVCSAGASAFVVPASSVAVVSRAGCDAGRFARVGARRGLEAVRTGHQPRERWRRRAAHSRARRGVLRPRSLHMSALEFASKVSATAANSDGASSPSQQQQQDGVPFAVDNFVNGKLVATKSRFDVVNPASNKVVACVSDGGAEEAERAIEAAHAAFPAWRDTPVPQRASILRKWFDLLMENRDRLARLLTLENGKPLAEAAGEISYGSSFIKWFAEEAPRAYGDVIPATAGDGRQALAIRQALGVCTSITSWNFPNAMVARKVAPALAAGNVMVARPSEQTPLSAIAMAELAHDAGVPPGVFNVVAGKSAKAFGDTFSTHPLVRMLGFTGSTAVGKHLLSQCAGTMKRTGMELGGLAPMIVFDDADLDAAAAGLWAGKMRGAGQTCISPNRVYVHSAVYDDFVERVAARARDAKVGDGLQDGTQVGPLINDGGVQKVQRHVQDCVDKGAHIVFGGRHLTDIGPNFYAPTVLRDVTDECVVNREETFGPVFAIMRFDDEAEALRRANNTVFGLASYVYTRDLGRAFRVATALESGIVGVNEGVVSNAAMPFGGVKESGHGREGSKYGLDEYTDIKYVLIGGIGTS